MLQGENLFDRAKAVDKTGRSGSRRLYLRLEWILGTILTANRRKSFICDTGGQLCYMCQLFRFHIKQPKHAVVLFIMQKTGRAFVHSHIKGVRFAKIGRHTGVRFE